MVVAPRVLRQTFPGEHPVQWRTASPLWNVLQAAADTPVFAQPAMLRFTTDAFMEDFLTVATETPTRLWEWQVQKETWRNPAPIPPLRLVPRQMPSSALTNARQLDDPSLQNESLKLYQPAHERYYLVAANLVCRIPGLPDKTLKTTQRETVSFVVRRLMAIDKVLQEHAFVNGFWQPVESTLLQSLRAGEQTFPMFPVTYTHTADGYTRRMFSGLIPVSNREAFLNAGLQPNVTGDSIVGTEGDRRDRLLTSLQVDVIAPWRNINQSRSQEDRNLEESWKKLEANPDRRPDLLASVHLAQDKLQTSSWYVLLDLAYYLRDYLPAVWNRLEINSDIPAPAGTLGKALLDTLRTTTFKPETSEDFNSLTVLQNKLRGVSDANGRTSLAKALKDVYAARVHLENATAPYSYKTPAGWPASQFLLCGNGVNSLVNGEDLDNLVLVQRIREALTELPPNANQRIPLVPTATALIKSQNEANYSNDLFLIRCVYERPNCPPSVHPTVVSEPTQSFQMASYFDPDAPARPIRIPMPIDTSPAGLRKFAKNTMFVMSDTLACQVEKARDLTFGDLVLSVLPWPFHKDLSGSAGGCTDGKLGFGKICTFSIPIITLCALIILIIFVSLLDIIFKWVPFLIFCLPLPKPGLKAKK